MGRASSERTSSPRVAPAAPVPAPTEAAPVPAGAAPVPAPTEAAPAPAPAGAASAPAGIPPVGPMRRRPEPAPLPADPPPPKTVPPKTAPSKTAPSSRRAPKSGASAGVAAAARPTAAPPNGPPPQATARAWPWTREWPVTREQARTLAVPALLAGSTIVVALALLLGATAAIAPIVIGYSVLAPGLALVRLARLGEPVLEAVTAVVISVSITGLLALVQVYTELWSPTTVTWALVGLTALGLAGDPVIVPASARARIAARLAPLRQALAAARARAGAWLATPSGWGAEPEDLALDGGIRARLAGRRTARELRPPVEVAVPSLAARRRRLAATGRPATAPDHLLEPPRGVGPTTDGFFDGLIERHEKGPPAEPDAGPSRPD